MFFPARVPAFQLVVEDDVNARSPQLFDPSSAVCNFFLVVISREEVVYQYYSHPSVAVLQHVLVVVDTLQSTMYNFIAFCFTVRVFD